MRVLTTCSVLVGLMLTGVPALAGQEGETYTAPRTADGYPDFKGVWEHNVATPLERPEAWAGKANLTPEELARVQANAARATDPSQDALFGDQLILAAIDGEEATSYDPTTGNYNQFWIADRFFTAQTSLVVDPPNGRIPAMMDDAITRQAAQRAYREAHPADTYRDRPLSERCVSYGAPRIGAGYNSYYQVFQGKDHVVILQEMIHDARVIPIVDLAPVDDDLRQLHGVSRGRYEGDTLVIETTNYTDEGGYRGANQNLTVTERLTREASNVLRYEVTFDDPTTWAAPWTVSIPLRSTPDALYEYACHEGNIGMEGILAGHRAEERASGEQ